MPLTLIDAPDAALDEIREHVPLLVADAATLEITPPYPLYTFRIESVMGGQPLTDACLTAWQCLLVRNETPIAIAEVAAVTEQGDDDVQFVALYPREDAEILARAVADAEALPELDQQTYALRLLRAPSVSLLALWLKGAPDIIIPLQGMDASVAPMIWKGAADSPEAALARRLRPLANQRLNARDR